LESSNEQVTATIVSPAEIDRQALNDTINLEGGAFAQAIAPIQHQLYSNALLHLEAAQIDKMRAVINAVEEVVGEPESNTALGVFYGYDFHVNDQGVHLIEVNTNAGGAFLNALLIESQCGGMTSDEDLEQNFIQMFRNEWQRVRGDAPLKFIAIVDDDPESQFLYPEFLLAKQMFERAGIATYIVDPAKLHVREEGLYVDGQRIDLIYNRLTDFDLTRYPHIRTAWEMNQVVLTPNPEHYGRYADKRKLALFSDAHRLQAEGVSQASIDALLSGVPETKVVRAEDAEQWWAERKQWFFKPMSGYGSKGAYRGDKVTKRVFEEIMQSDYVAQRLAVPGECLVMVGEEVLALKYDIRCYVYAGHIQLISARLYQGQTTNFRTSGGGFGLVLKNI
jgi:glutathione synthase/RimK-type ligase-like ATP-grasp enzyme